MDGTYRKILNDVPPVLETETDPKVVLDVMMTAEEERELAELMDDDD